MELTDQTDKSAIKFNLDIRVSIPVSIDLKYLLTNKNALKANGKWVESEVNEKTMRKRRKEKLVCD